MGNIEIPGGCVLAKPPEYYGRKSLKPLTDRVPKVDRAARGRCRHRPGRHWDPAIGMLHQAVRRHGDGAALRHRRLLRLSPRSAHRHARSRGDEACAGQAEAARLHRRALLGDGLVLRRHPARVDLPRARQHPVPACPARCRCSPCATRRSRRASTAARPGGSSARSCAAWASRRRSTSRPSRSSGTTSSRAPASPSPRCARTGIVRLADAPKLTPRDKLRFPTPSGKIEIESEVLKKAGLPSLPPYEPKAAPTGDRFTPAVREDRRRWRTASRSTTRSSTRSRRSRCSGSTPTAPGRSASATATRSRSAAAAATPERCKAKVTPWIHPEAVFMLHGYGATVPLATRALRRRRGRPAPAARQALRLRPGRRRLRPDRDHRPDQAGGGGRCADEQVHPAPRRGRTASAARPARSTARPTRISAPARPRARSSPSARSTSTDGRACASSSCPASTARTRGA